MFSEIVLVAGKVHQFCCAFLEKTVLFQKNIRKGFQRKSYSIHSDEKHLLFRAFGQYRCATSSLVKFYLGIRLVLQKKVISMIILQKIQFYKQSSFSGPTTTTDFHAVLPTGPSFSDEKLKTYFYEKIEIGLMKWFLSLSPV